VKGMILEAGNGRAGGGTQWQPVSRRAGQFFLGSLLLLLLSVAILYTIPIKSIRLFRIAVGAVCGGSRYFCAVHPCHCGPPENVVTPSFGCAKRIGTARFANWRLSGRFIRRIVGCDLKPGRTRSTIAGREGGLASTSCWHGARHRKTREPVGDNVVRPADSEDGYGKHIWYGYSDSS